MHEEVIHSYALSEFVLMQINELLTRVAKCNSEISINTADSVVVTFKSLLKCGNWQCSVQFSSARCRPLFRRVVIQTMLGLGLGLGLLYYTI